MMAWVFPGQGSQRLGMGSGLASDVAGEVFAEASAILGWDVVRVCREGPEARLAATEVTQPSVVTVATAAARTLEARGVFPDVIAGHSVGEFAALTVAGAMRFDEALRAVAARADAMRWAGRAHPGGMAAVLGLPGSTVAELCAQADGVVAPANFNGPEQVVISGESDALAAVAAMAKAQGARVIKLNVSVAAHSPLVRAARDALAAALAGVRWSTPRVPFVAGVDGLVHEDPNDFAELLIEGVSRPVRWVDCVETMSGLGANLFVEVGPGEVLSGLIKRIAPGASVEQVGDDEAAATLAERFVTTGERDGSIG